MPATASLGHASVPLAKPLREEEEEVEGEEDEDVDAVEWGVEDLDDAEGTGQADFYEDGGEFGDDWLELEEGEHVNDGMEAMDMDSPRATGLAGVQFGGGHASSGGSAQRSPVLSPAQPEAKRAILCGADDDRWD